MKKFLVNIRETLERVVEVEAKDWKDAIDKVEDKYRNEEIVLDSGDFVDTDFSVKWEE